ncbi:putative sulfur carrier protein AF_0552 [[Clostridium] ultunense Esp]|nr:putative sulfur carrier protein AF_0552 [[Clostridium] ultunense Esp]
MNSMAKVKLFGIYSIKVGKNELIIKAKNIEELLIKLSEIEPNLTMEELKRSLIFVNNRNITELSMFKTKIDHNDNISILSPIAGG